MTRPWAGEESLSSALELGVLARYRLWTVRKGRAVVELSAQTGCADEEAGRFALACGTPAVGPARQWAQLLARHACRAGIPATGTLQTWLAPAHREWRAQLAPAKEPLWATVSHSLPVLGAAALGLIELSPADHPERFHIEAVLQGEVCLFVVRGTHTRLRMPALQAADLTGNGASLFSEPIAPRLPPATVSTDARFGDVIVLASPSLGAWLYQRLEEGRDPWQLLFNLPDDQYFANIVRNERDNERLPDDDVSLMIIRTDPLPDFNDLDVSELTSRLIDPDLLTPELPEPAPLEEAPTEQDLSPFDAPAPPMALDLPPLPGDEPEPLEALASEEDAGWDDWDDGEDLIEALESEEVPRPGTAVIALNRTMALTFSESDRDDVAPEEDWSSLQESMRPGAVVEIARAEVSLDSGVWEDDLVEEDDELLLDEALPPPTEALDPAEWDAEAPRLLPPTTARDERPEEDAPANQRWLVLAAVLVLIASAFILADRIGGPVTPEPPPAPPTLAASAAVAPPPPALLRAELQQADDALAALSQGWIDQRPKLVAQADAVTGVLEAEAAATREAEAAAAREAEAVAAREAEAQKAREAEARAAREAEARKQREAAQAAAAAAAPKPAPKPQTAPKPEAKPQPAPAPRRAPAGIQASAGAPSTGWIRCSQPCAASGSTVTLPSLAPIWQSPFSSDRVGVAASGSYPTVGSQQVGGDLWVEVKLTR